VQDYIKKLREEVMALGDEMVKSIRFALRHELDGRLANEMLKDIGVIQPRAQAQLNNQSEVTEEQFEKNLTGEWLMKLDLVALEKSRVYGTTLPPGLEERVMGYLQSQAALEIATRGVEGQPCKSVAAAETEAEPSEPDASARLPRLEL
jgi:hypothetical protein